LQSVYDYLLEHPKVNLNLVGFACTTHGSDKYNLDLSKRRARNTYDKLVSMGVPSSRLSHDGKGKDKRYVGKYNSDLAKRVEIRIQ